MSAISHTSRSLPTKGSGHVTLPDVLEVDAHGAATLPTIARNGAEWERLRQVTNRLPSR